MAYVRVRPAELGGPCAVRHPEHGEYVVPNPAQPYDERDPIVKAYPWLFVRDGELNLGDVEQATRAPGGRRIIRRG